MPQAPLRALQSANRLDGQVCVGRAKAASSLQSVFEAHRSVPPVKHDRGVRQRLALRPPQPGIAVAQHRRWRVRRYACRREDLLERIRCDRRRIACESRAGLAALSVNHLAGNHLKLLLVLAVLAADVAAVQSQNDGIGRPRCRRLRLFAACGYATASPARMVLFRTVPALCAPPTSSSQSRSATLPNGVSATYRTVT